MADRRTDGQIENGDFIELSIKRGSNITKKGPWSGMVDWRPHEITVPKIARIYGFPKSQIFDINISINMTAWGCYLN